MEIDKLKQMLDTAQQFQSEAFWKNIFDSSNPNSPSLTPLSISEFIPKCDLYEADKTLVAELEIPGILREHLDISIQEQMLIIAGEFKTLQQNRKYYVKERASRKFRKEVALPYPILFHKVKMDLKNGILTMIMPINQEEVETIPISIYPANSE